MKKENENKNKNGQNKDNFNMEGTPADKPGGRVAFGRHFPLFLLIFCVAAFIIVRPLLNGMAWGTVFAFMWHPVQRFIRRRGRLARHPNLSTALSFALLLITVTIPLVFALQAVVKELATAYDSFTQYISHIRETGLPPLDAFIPPSLSRWISPLVADQERIAGILSSVAQNTATFLRGLSRGVLHWTGSFILQGFIALVTMFFLLRDGEKVVAYIRDFIPLSASERDRFVKHTGAVMNSVIYGVILTVGVQSILGGLGWWVAGLPNAFLAAAAMFIFGMFPFGTSVIWLPGGIYLVATGSVGWGIALLVWGGVVVSSMDNLLRPIFIGSAGSMPTYAIIIGLTGGIAAWGLLGVFLGPLVLALFLSVLDLYRTRIRSGDPRV